MYRHQTNGFSGASINRCPSSAPMNRLVDEGAILVPMTMPCVWRYIVLVKEGKVVLGQYELNAMDDVLCLGLLVLLSLSAALQALMPS